MSTIPFNQLRRRNEETRYAFDTLVLKQHLLHQLPASPANDPKEHPPLGSELRAWLASVHACRYIHRRGHIVVRINSCTILTPAPFALSSVEQVCRKVWKPTRLATLARFVTSISFLPVTAQRNIDLLQEGIFDLVQEGIFFRTTSGARKSQPLLRNIKPRLEPASCHLQNRFCPVY